MIHLIKSALKDITANKMRSLLTILGILIGIASVTSMVSIGESAQVLISQSISQRLNKDMLMVMLGNQDYGGGFSGMSFSPSAFLGTFKEEDYKALESIDDKDILRISRRGMASNKLRYGNQEIPAMVLTVDSDFLRIMSYKILSGVGFTGNSSANSREVVLGAGTAKKLFKYQDPVGKEVYLDGKRYLVIGVTEGLMEDQHMDSYEVYVLFDSYAKTFGDNTYSMLFVQVSETADHVRIEQLIEKSLRKSRGLAPEEEKDFTVSSQTEILETTQLITGTVTLFISVISSISLVVGGVGVMNIMLVSVKERVKEIGLRKAIGASNAVIRKQILIESVLFSIIGAICGIVLGSSAALVIQYFGGLPYYVSLNAIISSLAVSSLIGILFGLYPAIQASRLSPIEALRSN